MRFLHVAPACEIGRSAATMPSFNAKPLRRPEKPRGRPPLLADAQILELRALAEFAGWQPGRLAARFGVDLSMVKRILSGVTRARLVAKREHLPAGVVA